MKPDIAGKTNLQTEDCRRPECPRGGARDGRCSWAAIRLLASVSALLGVLFVGCESRPLPFLAKDEVVAGWRGLESCGATAFDPLHDSADLVAYYTNDWLPASSSWHCEVVVADTARVVVAQLILHRKLGHIGARDVTGDGRDELLLFFKDDTSSSVVFYKLQDNKLDSIGAFVVHERDFRWRGYTTWDAEFELGCPIPNDVSGTPRLLLLLGADHGKMPRGMILLDPLSCQAIWSYWLSNKIDAGYHFLQDVNGDSVPEIIFGSYGPGNGAAYEDTRDVNGYLQAVTLEGKRLWSLIRKGPNGGIYVAPCPARTGQSSYVIALSIQNFAYGDSARLMRIDALTGDVLRSRAIYTRTLFDFIAPWGFTPDGRRTYLVSLEQPRAGMFTEDLDLIREFDDLPLLHRVEDINDDGHAEFIGRMGWHTLVILDSSLQPIAKYPTELTTLVLQHRPGNWAVFWLTDRLELRRIHLEPNPRFRNYRLRLWTTILGSSTGGFALIALSVYGTRQVLRARRAIRQTRREREQMQAMTPMVQTMGHELKTPLDLLSDATFYLERELQGDGRVTSDSLQPYLEDFRYVQRELRDRSAELQKFVGLTALQFTTFDFADLVRHVVTTEFRRPDVVFSLDFPPDLPPITADRQQLQRVIRNLVKNSLKAMKAGGTLTVRINLIEEKAQNPTPRRFLQVVIQDTGCGIAAEDLARVFDPSFTRFEGGSGLGLAIVRKAVEDHHGHISVISELGRGTTVTVSLPLTPEEES